MRANETYSDGNRQFSVRNRDVLMNAQSPYKWWSTLKSTVFSWNSSLPPLAGEGGGMVCESVGKTGLLSDHFDGKQSREFGLLASPIPICPSNASPIPNRPLTCHLSQRLTTFAFRSSEVRRLLLDLDLYDGTDPLCMFALFNKRTTYVLDPRLSKCFSGLFVWVVSRLAGDRPMSRIFRRFHRPPLLPITNRFR